VSWHSKKALQWLVDSGLREDGVGDFSGKIGRLEVAIEVASTNNGKPYMYQATVRREFSGGHYEVEGVARTPWKAWDNCLDAARRVHNEMLIGQSGTRLKKIGGTK
jgi:hypothetical protein